jgi:hypothetical protein
VRTLTAVKIWRCACGTLNDQPKPDERRFCTGCRFEDPTIEATYTMVTDTRIDDAFTLDGDEDGGVGIVCRLCDLGGQPIAYLGYSNPYATVPDVEYAPTITALLDAATRHLSDRH